MEEFAEPHLQGQCNDKSSILVGLKMSQSLTWTSEANTFEYIHAQLAFIMTFIQILTVNKDPPSLSYLLIIKETRHFEHPNVDNSLGGNKMNQAGQEITKGKARCQMAKFNSKGK